LDLIEEARASLELAAHAWSAQAAVRHCHRAAQLAEEVGIMMPSLLTPAWQALLGRAQDGSAALSQRTRPVQAAGFSAIINYTQLGNQLCV
jgi:hypothetical protein